MHQISFFFTLMALFASVSNAFSPNALAAGPAAAEADTTSNEVPAAMQDIGIKEHLGSKVSIESLHFKNEKGETVALKDYFPSHRPVLLTLVYFECPNLCNLVLNGLTKSLGDMEWEPGKQFDIVAVSINPNEKPELAAAKKEAYLKMYGKPETAAGWHFLTGEEPQIRQLASEVGFLYKKDGEQYAHAAALYALTPEGKISRYLYGIEFKPTDLKMALLEASNGKIGSVVDRILLFCYHYDPVTRKYSIYLTRVMTGGMAGSALFFGAYLAVFWNRERRRRPEQGSNEVGSS
ncbi:MAG: SCO family protein [Bdellovibrionia bacterium]